MMTLQDGSAGCQTARRQRGGISSERGAPPELVALVGRRPLADDHPCRPLSSWSLLVVGGVVNFCSDKYWSFSARSRVRPRHAVGRSRSSRRLRRLILGSVLAVLSVVLFTDVFILAVSAFMILVAVLDPTRSPPTGSTAGAPPC
jgi:hypothetical protein